ncbi:MAG: polymer-forming cytoskeletal protein [Betaproteobacteria bacterium]|nr:polymer-forming cytoskeletal protein [Betaproteobacteria bacterium]
MRQFLLFGLGMLLAHTALATNYSFPSNMPAGCSNAGGGNYTCGSVSLNWGDTITISGQKLASIAFGGNLSIQNTQINTTGSASNLFITVNGTLFSNTGAAIIANLTVNGAANFGYQNQITGNVNAVSVNDGGNTTFNGNITASNGVSVGYGTQITGNVTAASVTDAGNATYTGNITATNGVTVGYGTQVTGNVTAGSVSDSGGAQYGGSVTATSGSIALQSDDQVTGSVTAKANNGGNITLASNTQVSGCVQTPSNNSISLAWNAGAGGVCCLSGSSCGTSCVSNNSGQPTPPTCGTSSLSLLSQYHMDEPQWTGAPGQVADSSGSGYNATAVNGVSTANTNPSPAIAGNPGTCGYGAFNPNTKDYYVALPANFPHLTSDFTITAWMYTLNNSQPGQRILEDDQNNSGGYGFSLGDGGTGTVRFFARGSNPVILDTPAVINNNTWYFVAAAVSGISQNQNGFCNFSPFSCQNTRYIYVFNANGNLITSVNTNASGWGTDTGTVSIGGEVNNACCDENNPRFHFDGSLDEVQVFNGALTQQQISVIAQQTHPCPNTIVTPGSFNAYDHSTPAGAITGNITTKISGASFGTDGTTSVDIIALNPTRTAILTTFTGPVKVDLLDSSSGGVPDSNGCNAGWPIIQTLVPNPIFTPPDNGRLTVNVTENNAWPNVRVRITYPAFGPAVATGCSTDNFAIRPYSFDPVSASDQDWATAGTARPLYNTSATGGDVHKAGQPFTLGATAINAAGNTTTNYAGNPAAVLTACILPASCTPGILGTGTWSSASGVITTNTATYSDVGAFTAQLVDSTFASVDASQESATLLDITSVSFNIGRFVPDHFDLLNPNTPWLQTFGTSDAQCNTPVTPPTPKRSFTYIGQAFGYLTVPQATVYARNAGGGTTLNYVGNLWHIPAGTTPPLQPPPVYSSTTLPVSTNTLDTGLVTPPTVAQNNGVAPNNSGPGTGLVSVNPTDQLAYNRNLTVPLQPPFNASISLTLSVTDSSESAVTGNGTINTLNPGTFSNIAFDSGNLFYYGRLTLSNASGSVNLPLPVPMQAQYWNGTNFVTNVADNCTDIAAGNIVMGNYQKNLAPCKTAAAISNPLLGGKGNLTLSAPGAGNNGSVDLAVNLAPLANGQTCSAPDGSICLTASPPNDQTCLISGGTQSTSSVAGLSWLQGKWSGTSYDLDPIARATFGIYKNANQFIFMREMY